MRHPPVVVRERHARPARAAGIADVAAEGGFAAIAALVAVVVLGVLLHRLVVFPTVVRSDSMRPALESGDVLLTSRARRRARVRRGEILVYRWTGAPGTRIRRLIGLPGDRVRIAEDGVVIVNGEPVFEPYARRSSAFRGSFVVPADRYFVLSDHRGERFDTPAWRESFVPVDDLLGVARARLFPWPIAATGILAR